MYMKSFTIKLYCYFAGLWLKSITEKHLSLVVFFIWRKWRLIQKWPKYETAKYKFEFGYTIGNKWAHTVGILVSVSPKQNFWAVDVEEITS